MPRKRKPNIPATHSSNPPKKRKPLPKPSAAAPAESADVKNGCQPRHFIARAPGEVRLPVTLGPPSSLPTEPLRPPHANDPSIRDSLRIVPITGTSRIRSKVRHVLALLQGGVAQQLAGNGSNKSAQRAAVVALVAKSLAANKSISIAEITKRIYRESVLGNLYQYTGSWSRLEKVVERQNTQQTGISMDSDPLDTSEDDAFELAALTEGHKVRNVAALAIYLTTEPVALFQREFGQV